MLLCVEPVSMAPFKLSDPMAFADHVLRHHAESGAGGQLFFSPVWGLDRSQVADYCERRLRTPIGAPGWGRGFALREGQLIVGHAELRGGVVVASQHRAEFSIGIEQRHRGKGHGRRLLQACLDFAMALPMLRWIDLRVFGHNELAKALYLSMGFRQVGSAVDAFRMQDGSSVDDIHMVKELVRFSGS